MSDKYIGDYKVGRLLCGSFRDALERLKFDGHDIRYLESSGWIVRTFTVSASKSIHNALIKMIDEINKDET